MVILVCLFIAFPTLKGLLVGKPIPPLSLASVWRFSFFLTFGAAVLAGLGIEWLGQKRRWIGAAAVTGLIVTGLWQWQHVIPFGPAANLYPQSSILRDAALQTQSRMWAKDSDLDQFMPYNIPTVLGYDSLYPQLYLDLWRTNSIVVKKYQLVIHDPNPNVLEVTGVDSLLTLQPLPAGWHAITTQGSWTLAKPNNQPEPIHTVQKLVATTRPAAIQEIDLKFQALVAGIPQSLTQTQRQPSASCIVKPPPSSSTSSRRGIRSS